MIDDPLLPPVGVLPAGDGLARWRVWAPQAKADELVLGDGAAARTVPMDAEPRGYFTVEAPCSGPGQLYRYKLDGGAPLLRPGAVAEMTREQAADGDTRRGLGWALWSPDREASGNPFGPGAYGHTGFTGTSLWVDPARGLVVALLTNDVYGGRQGRGIASLRVALHRALLGQV